MRLTACIVAIALAELLDGARTSADAEKQALAQIVMVGEPGDDKCNSAGIIVGDDGKNVYIVTTAHGLQSNQNVRVRFHAMRTRHIGKVLPSPFERAGEGDLAVIEVKKSSDLMGFLAGLKWDMLRPRSLPSEGSPVHSLGCSVGLAWNGGGNQERFFQSSDDEVQLQSAADRGQSGGAVFNEAWELIGMVRDVYDGRVGARRLDRIIDRIKSELPVKLRPRAEADRVLGPVEVAEVRRREALVRQLLVSSGTALQEKRLDAAQLLAAEAFDLDPEVARAGLYSAYIGALSLQRTLRGTTRLSSAKFSPDGRRVLTTGFDARLWDADTGRLIVAFPETTVSMRVEFSPDGTRVLLVTDRDRASLWKAENGTLVKALVGSQENAMFSPDGKLLVTISGLTARIWDAATGADAGVFDGFETLSNAVFSPDGRHLLTVGLPNPQLWDLQTHKVVRSFSEFHGGARFNHDGIYLLLSGDDPTSNAKDVTWLVNVNDGRKYPLTVNGQNHSGAFVPDNKHLLLTELNESYRFMELASGKVLPPFPGSGGKFLTIAFSPDGKLILSEAGRESRTAQVWNLEEGRLQATLRGDDADFDRAAFSPDGRQVLTAGGYSGVAKLWDIESGLLITTLTGHEGGIQSIEWEKTGEHILTTGSDGTARIWTPFAQYAGRLPSDIREGMFSPDAAEFLSLSDAIRVRDTRTGRLLHEMKPLEGRTIFTAAACPDGWNALIGGTERDEIELWNVGRNSLAAQLKNPVAHDLAWTSIGKDCRYGLAQENGAGTIWLWDLQQRRLIRKFDGYGSMARFTPDGERILLSSVPGHPASLVTAAGGPNASRIPGGENIRDISMSADGKKFLVLEDKTVRLWDSAGDRILTTIPIDVEGAERCQIGPSGKRGFVSNGISSWLRLLDLEAGKIVGTIEDSQIGAVFSDNDRWLLTQGASGTQLWDMGPAQPVRQFQGRGLFQANVSPDGGWVITSDGIRDAITGNLLARFSILSYQGSALFSSGNQRLAITNLGTGELWRLTPYPPERDMAAFLRTRVGRGLTPEERRAAGLPAAP